MSRARGDKAEARALQYLKDNGLTVLEKNYDIRIGEIDLIMLDGEVIVFTEVRYRQRSDFGGAISSISEQKKRRIIRVAEHYLVSNQKYDKMASRFDVVCLDGENNVEWIKNAFTA